MSSQSSDAATPFSIDDILGKKLSESNESEHYHQHPYHHPYHLQAKRHKPNYRRPSDMQGVTMKSVKQEEAANERPNYLIDSSDDGIDEEITKIRQGFARNYSSYAFPRSYNSATRVARNDLQEVKQLHSKHTMSPLLQQDKQQGGTSEETLQQSPSTCSVGDITVILENSDLWRAFNKCGTEMILNRSGRRMFPYVNIRIKGMDPKKKYSVKIDIRSEDDRRYKFINSKWIPVGLADMDNVNSLKLHADSPNTGAYWMKHEICFAKLKITNNKDTKDSRQVILHSMHKYKPWIVITEEPNEEEDIELNKAVHFAFDITSFVAVTAYQNENITQLKIHNNPFAKAFRDTDVTAIIEGACMLAGNPTAAINAMYGNETDGQIRNAILSRPTAYRIPELHQRDRRIHYFTDDQRLKLSQEHRFQALRHHSNYPLNTYMDYYIGQRKHYFNRNYPYASYLRSLPAVAPFNDSYPGHYNKVKKLNHDINEWFDLSKSAKYQERLKKSKIIKPTTIQLKEEQDQRKHDEEKECANTVNESVTSVHNDDVKNEHNDLNERKRKHPMIRVPAFYVGASSDKLNSTVSNVVLNNNELNSK
ncbi:uncharacterized protein [Antedon mediterranea]|uniref:uncharacterized protein n=1 Tax=Antedon mediterranea TaxID=105859 RepID=UPI003AF48046